MNYCFFFCIEKVKNKHNKLRNMHFVKDKLKKIGNAVSKSITTTKDPINEREEE